VDWLNFWTTNNYKEMKVLTRNQIELAHEDSTWVRAEDAEHEISRLKSQEKALKEDRNIIHSFDAEQIKALKRIVETGRQVLLDLGFSGEELDQALKNG